jgi:hypothetical protein
MKKLLVFLTILLCGLYSKAQQDETPKTTETARTLWLYNNGKIITNQDYEVDKSYFNSEKIFLQSNPPQRKGQKNMLVITPKKGESRAYAFENTELSDELIQRILEQKEGTRLLFAIMEEKNRVMLSFTLK